MERHRLSSGRIPVGAPAPSSIEFGDISLPAHHCDHQPGSLDKLQSSEQATPSISFAYGADFPTPGEMSWVGGSLPQQKC